MFSVHSSDIVRRRFDPIKSYYLQNRTWVVRRPCMLVTRVFIVIRYLYSYMYKDYII